MFVYFNHFGSTLSIDRMKARTASEWSVRRPLQLYTRKMLVILATLNRIGLCFKNNKYIFSGIHKERN